MYSDIPQAPQMHLHIVAFQTFVVLLLAPCWACVVLLHLAFLRASVVEARSNADEVINSVLHSWEPLTVRGGIDVHAKEPLVEAGRLVRVVVSLVYCVSFFFC